MPFITIIVAVSFLIVGFVAGALVFRKHRTKIEAVVDAVEKP